MAKVFPLERLSVDSKDPAPKVRKVVATITFEGDPNHLYEDQWGSVTSVANISELNASRVDTIDKIELRPYAFVGQVFTSLIDGKIDVTREQNFSRLRYLHFGGAFRKVSILMAIGTLVPAAYAAMESRWLRFSLLAGLISPLYASYAMITCTKGFAKIAGTAKEKLIVLLLIFHCLCIHASEWARPRPDYGLIVMHFCFIHNFTPMGVSTMHIISMIFVLPPYLFIQIFRLEFPDATLIDVEEPEIFTHTKKLCIKTTGAPDVVLGIFVTLVLLLFQTIITIVRNREMKVDMLHQEQLKAQQKKLDFERKTSEDTLRSMLPRQIIAALKNNEAVEPQLFMNVTVIFAEICDFDAICAELEPRFVVEVLNVIFLEFDRLSDLLHVYKVETVGQVYMAVVGCPEHIVNHADVGVHFALACLEAMNHLTDKLHEIQIGCTPHPRDVQARVGLNSGRIRAGVVGLESPRYKLVGDAVNTASRMESTSTPGRVQVSPSTLEQLSKDTFLVEDRGEINAKGKGMIRTAFINGYSDPDMSNSPQVVIETTERAGSNEEEDADPVSPKARTSVLKKALSIRVSQDAVRRGSGPGGLNRTMSQQSQQSQQSNASGLSGKTSCSYAEPTSPMMRALNHHHNLESPAGRLNKMNTMSSNMGSLPALNVALQRNMLASSETEYESQMGSLASIETVSRRVSSWAERANKWFLFTSPAYTEPEFLQTLKEDKPAFEEATLLSRIAFSRNLTLLWLLVLSIVSAADYQLEVIGDDVDRFRSALVIRMTVNYVVGILYLLFLAMPTLFNLYAQRMSIVMLIAQGAALLFSGMFIYNNESFVIVLFGIYVSSFTVCTISDRLCIYFAAVIGYLFVEFIRCDMESVKTEAMSIAFLIILFCFIVSSIRLEEFMAHVSHYETECLAAQREEMKIMKASSHELLISLLPPHVVTLVHSGVSPIAEYHEDVTVIFTDIKGFTSFSSQLLPVELMAFLNSMYSAFDEVILNWGLYKVEVIGDAYCISSGCPAESPPWKVDESAMRAVECALSLLRTMSQVCNDTQVQMRVGVHSGPVVAGVVGKKGPRFHLFGPTVVYAEKMESNGEPGRVQISDATMCALQGGLHDYDTEARSITVEGMEEIQRTWFVNKSRCKEASNLQRALIIARRSEHNREAQELQAQAMRRKSLTNDAIGSEGDDMLRWSAQAPQQMGTAQSGNHLRPP